MASVAAIGSVLMQSVEPLEDFLTGVTDLIPMPNPVAPSANEVKIALARRRILDRERVQQQQRQAFQQEADAAAQDQLDQAQARDAGGPEGNAAFEDAVTAMDAPGSSLIAKRPGAAAPDTASQAPALTASTCELAVDNPADNRLVLPVLESLIALRRSRLTRTAPQPQLTQQQQQQPYPPQRQPTMSFSGGTASGADAPWAAGAKGAGGPKPPARRFTPATPAAQPSRAAAAAAPDGGAPDGAGPGGPSSRGQVFLNAPSGMQPPPLSQFPGPFRATRKWDATIFDAPGGSAALAAAAAAAAAADADAPVTMNGAGPGPSPSGASLTGATRPGAAAAKGRSPGPSWMGNEQVIERSTTGGGGAAAAGSFTAAMRPGPTVAATAAATAAAMASVNSEVSVCRTSRASPRTSVELGRASSSVDGGGDDSSARARALARQRAMLAEWQSWRDRGGLGPPPGIDEETDDDGGDDSDGDARRGGRDGEDDEDEDDEHGLLLGLTSGARRSREKPNAAAAAAAGTDDEVPEAQRSAWRRTRRITQCFDIGSILGGGGGSGPAMPAAAPAPPPGLLVTSGLPSPPAPLSPSQAASPTGLVPSAPLSPMASRRQKVSSNGGGGGGRPAAGPVGLSVWLNKAFGGGDAATAADEGGGRAAAAAAAPAASTSSRIPSLAAAKHLSFTSKFNRFKERIQSLSIHHHSHSQPPSAGGGIEQAAAERTPSIAVASRARIVGSNDGRGGFGIGSPASPDSPQFVIRQPPPAAMTGGRKGAPGGGGGAVPDLHVRPTGRASADAVGSKVQQPSSGGAGSRLPTRHSLDSRMPSQTSRGGGGARVAPDTTAAAAGGLGGGGPTPPPPPPPGLHESLMVVTNSVDRSRHGQQAFMQQAVLPPVRLL